VLQAIGGAGLLTLLVIRTKPWVRVIAGLILLAGFQWLLSDPFVFNAVFGSEQNSIIGSLSWGGMLILATAAADGFLAAKTPVRRTFVLLLSGLAALAAGLVLSQWFPVSKNRASISYMLVSCGICLLVFLLFHMLMDGRPHRLRLLCAAGKNPLAMYVAQLLILGVFTLPGAAFWYADAPAWLATVQGAVLIGSLLLLAWWMEKRNIIIKL
jgi:predicted acyltransferase